MLDLINTKVLSSMCALSVSFMLVVSLRFGKPRLTAAMSRHLAAARQGKRILADYNDELIRNAGALYQGDWARYWNTVEQRWWHKSPDECEGQWEDEATPYTCTSSWRTWWLLADGSWHWGPGLVADGRIPRLRAVPNSAPK